MTKGTVKKPVDQDWHPADIKAALHKKGITLAALAKAYGMTSSSSMSAALVRSMWANEQRIADAIGVHPKVIWPSRYNSDGTRKPVGFRAIQCTPVILPRNGQTVAAGGKLQRAA